MTKTLSQIRKEAVNPKLSPSVCEALLQWHQAAQRENIPWRKLELLAFSEELPQKPAVRFKAGTKLLRSYQGKSHLVIVSDDKKNPSSMKANLSAASPPSPKPSPAPSGTATCFSSAKGTVEGCTAGQPLLQSRFPWKIIGTPML